MQLVTIRLEVAPQREVQRSTQHVPYFEKECKLGVGVAKFRPIPQYSPTSYPDVLIYYMDLHGTSIPSSCCLDHLPVDLPSP